MHHAWAPRGTELISSPPRSSGPEHKRWAAVDTALPLLPLRTGPTLGHPGEEGLCLARVQLGRTDLPAALVACSVLPWRGAGPSWPGLPAGQAAAFCHVLDHHVDRIHAERMPGEPLIWGGDFNQQLARPFWASTAAGAAALRDAFDAFCLVALTERAEHLNPGSTAIDHLAVSRELLDRATAAVVHRPAVDGAQVSDHAAYTAVIRLPSRAAA